MKLLQNPWIVAMLGTGAAGVLVMQFTASGPRLPVPLTHKQAGILAVNTPPVMAATPDTTPAGSPTLSIDLSYVRAHVSGWLTGTQRDPFYQARPVAMVSTNALIQQLSRLKLEAIWRQDGISMVAISGAIYHEGDAIEGGKVLRIDGNGVWLEYGGQREFIVFAGEPRLESSNPPPLPAPAR